MTFAVAAAGTGGHVYPALAVADALVEAGVAPGDIAFFGGDRMEKRTVPAAGYPFVQVDVRGLRRSLSLDNIRLPAVVMRAARAMADEMRDRKVRVVTVFGGYVSVPAALAARRIGATLFAQEQNAVPGLANRLVARRAQHVFVGFPAAMSLPRSVLTGNPLREAFTRFDRDAMRGEALARYRLPVGMPVLGVLGGSLGARVLNDATARFAEDAEPGSVAIVHLTGRDHLGAIEPVAERSQVPWRPVAFEESMEWFYAAADMVLSRAGALTISELAATGMPAVVVPYAAGTAGHQGANAAQLRAVGGVTVVAESAVGTVPAELQQLLLDPARRRAMQAAASAQGRPEAARVVARALLEAVDHAG
jgi:UDP-N-acetylglucosamine--N-acetylmuramyl-(pentapeptide) pyrophosphoryl-undecaprenol N-acetylglucosamine transferase